uniref:Uncharacterized protein n=1 Tax=Anopheles darlingi TaxID=43151 RepID=A0A2M4DMB3_ANODA
MWTFACKRSPAQRKLTIVFFPFFLLPFTSVAESYCFTFTFTFARCTGHCDTGARTHTHTAPNGGDMVARMVVVGTFRAGARSARSHRSE